MKKTQVAELLKKIKSQYQSYKPPISAEELRFTISSWHETLKEIPDDCVDKIVNHVLRHESYPPSPAYFWKKFKQLEASGDLYDPIDISGKSIEDLKNIIIEGKVKNVNQAKSIVRSIRRIDSNWGYIQ